MLVDRKYSSPISCKCFGEDELRQIKGSFSIKHLLTFTSP